MPRQGAGSSDAALVIRKANASAIFPVAQKISNIKLQTFHQIMSNPKKSKEKICCDQTLLPNPNSFTNTQKRRHLRRQK